MVLENLTLGALDAESLNTAAQDDALNPLGGFNVPNVATVESAENATANNVLESQTEAGPGDPPGKSKGGGPSKESLELYNKQKQLLTNWSNNAATVAQTKRDPRLSAGRFEYDQFVTNVDRYRGYGKSTFNKLGFNPLEDNEGYYNANTNWYQDYRRMGSHMLSLFGSSFVDNSTPYGVYNLFSSDEMDSAGIFDVEAAENQGKHMRLGASSKGGITEFGNNFLLNSAFSFGIIANVAAEELVIAGATALTAPETGGASLIGGAAATANNFSKLGRIGRAWREGMALTQTGSLGRMAMSGGQMLTSLNKADAARSFWQAAKGFGNAAVDFANPLRGTTSAIRGMNAATGAAYHLNNAAKLSKGFGAFYRDLREFNFTLQEARLEGGGVYDRFVDEQITKIRKEGREPSEEELKNIYNYAETAAGVHGWSEIPLIFATNRIVFDGLFKFNGVRGLSEAAEAAERSAARGIGFDLASRSFREIPKAGFFKQLGRTIKNPRIYAGTFLNYTKANLAEGFQELSQETAADSIVKYYSQLYDNPENGNSDYMTGSLFSALGDQVFSKQGIETFMSGFLMGGLISGSVKGATNLLTTSGEALMKIKNPKEYNEYIQKKLTVKKDLVNTMNQIISDPERFFSSAKESFVTQKRANDNMVTAELNGDNKAFIDSKDDKTFDHVFTALNRGTFGMVVDGMKEMGKLDETEIAQAFNLPEGSKAKDKVNEYVKRAEQIKSRYEYFQGKMPNPFKPGKYGKNTPEFIQEFISFKAFEDARKAAIASQYGFDRALERMNSLTNELSQDRPVAAASGTDMTVLLNEKTLKEEIKLLKEEIKSTGEDMTAEQKAIVKNKTKRLEVLEDYQKNLKEYKKVRGTIKVTESGQIELFQDYNSEQGLRNSYESYLKTIAKLNDDYIFDDKISESFKKVMDFYELDEDSKGYNEIVNNLLNPDNFNRHYSRLFNTLSDLYQNREEITESSIDKFISVNEINALTVKLGELGVIINPDEVQDLVINGILPKTYLDMRSNKVIEPGDSRYEDIMEIINSFRDIQKEDTKVAAPKPAVEVAEPVEQVEEPAEKTEPVVIDAGIGPELRTKLEDAYNQYVADSGSDMTFDEYINSDSPTVRTIKSQFGVAQPPAQTTATAEAAPVVEQAPAEDAPSVAANALDDLKQLNASLQTGDEKTAEEKLAAIKIQSDEAAPVLDLNAGLVKVFTEERDKKLSDLMPVYAQGMRNPEPFADEAAALADPVKYLEDGINNEEYNIQLNLDRLKALDTTNPDDAAEAEKIQARINSARIRVEKSKAKLEKVKPIIAEYNDKMSRIGETPVAATPATEDTASTEPKQEDEKTQTPAEKTGTQKAQDLIDSVSSIRDLFDMNSDIAVELVNEGVSSLDLSNMLQNKRVELVRKISTNDLQKFDIVTLKDGSKVVYVYTKKDKVHVKTRNDAKGEYTVLNEEDFLRNIDNVEPAKTVTMEPTETSPAPTITEQDKKTVTSSRDTMDSFVNDPTRVKSAFDSIMNDTPADQSKSAEDDLLDSLGCDT